MWFRSPRWPPICWLLSVANIVSVWFAAQPAEPWHATAHAVLAVVFAVAAQHLRQRQQRAS